MRELLRRHGLTVRYSLVQGTYWMLYAAVSGFASVYLLDRGLMSSEVGVVIAAAGLLTAVLQPLLSTYADRPDALTVRAICRILGIGAAALSAVVLVCFDRPPLVTGVLYGGCYVMLLLLLPFVNALGTEGARDGRPLNWGIARGLGSLAYAVLAAALGSVIAMRGAAAVPVSMLIVFALFTASVQAFPFRRVTTETAKAPDAMEAPTPVGKERPFILRYPTFTLLLVGMVGLYVSHMMNSTYLYQIVVSKGGGQAENGMIMSVCAVVELPALFLLSLLLRKFGCRRLYIVAGAFMALKAVGTLLSPTVGWLTVAQMAQILGWGLMAAVPVFYVKERIPARDAIKGQGYMAMTNTLGNAVGSLLGGSLIDGPGIRAMQVVSMAAGIAGAVIVAAAIVAEKSVKSA